MILTAVAVAEMMRLLVDDKHIDWTTAWDVTNNSIAYSPFTYY